MDPFPHHSNVFPFTAIIGQDLMKEALILNAINPKIGGVLIKGEKGTAKSTAARALAELLPDIEVVADCPFHCNPRAHEQLCSECHRRQTAGEALPMRMQRTKMHTLPVSATEDRVVGTINLKKALEEGEVALEPGILAEVNRGILYIDEVNLLDNHVADLLLDAAAMGYNIVERENISYFHPARFILIGTMNPEEGDLRPQLLDRFGLCIEVKGEADLQRRVAIIRASQEFDRDHDAFHHKYENAQKDLRARVVRAKENLPRVTISDYFFQLVSLACIKMDVDGHRADITIVRTAKTIAAFNNRTRVNFEDVKKAMVLALPHRLRKGPFKTQKFDPDEFDQFLQTLRQELEKMGVKEDASSPNEVEGDMAASDGGVSHQHEHEHPHDSDHEHQHEADTGDEDPRESPNAQSSENQADLPVTGDVGEESEGFDGQEPLDLVPLTPEALENIDPADFFGAREPTPLEVFEIGEGIGDEARKTLLQNSVKNNLQQTKSRKGGATSENRQGRYVRYRIPRPGEKMHDLAVDATLRAAVLDSLQSGTPFRVDPSHFRLKVRKSPTNVLIIFVLDTSGSMAANKRMSAAKGAIFSLLEEIYVRKDKVALITFSGSGATLVLPPTNSVELASEVLQEIPTGGKTPLSAGLHKAIQIAIQEQTTRGLVPLIILLSDGKQNVPLYDSFAEDKIVIGDLLEAHSIPLVCIDTDLTRFNLGFARELADKFDAVYYELDRLKADRVAAIISHEYHEMTKVLDYA